MGTTAEPEGNKERQTERRQQEAAGDRRQAAARQTVAGQQKGQCQGGRKGGVAAGCMRKGRPFHLVHECC